jgi:hypothetical protein
MTFRHEYSEWMAELEPPVKPSLAERIAAMWGPRSQAVETDMFAWRSLDELIPISGDDHE